MDMIFHRDGRISLAPDLDGGAAVPDLRRVSSDRNRTVFLQAALLAHVTLQTGLTVRELLTCLAPWRKTMLALTGTDIDAWLKAAGPGPRVDNKSPRKAGRRRLGDISRVELRPHLEIGPEPRYKGWMRFKKDPDTGSSRVIFPDPIVSDRYTTQFSWSGVGVYRRPLRDRATGHVDRHCGLNFAPFAEWADLPIRINARMPIQEMTMPGHLTWKGPLLDRRNPLLADVSDRRGGVRFATLETRFDQAPFVDVIVQALCNDLLFFRTPDIAESEADRIRGLIAEADACETGHDPTAKGEGTSQGARRTRAASRKGSGSAKPSRRG